MLLYFWADWCPYCKEFDQAVLPDAEVDRAIAPAVKARLEPEKGSAEKALADQYGAHGYPSLFLIPAPGTRPMSLPSGISKGSPARPAEFSAAFRGQLAYAWGLAAKQAFDAGRYDDAIAYADQLVAYDPSYDQGYGYEIRAVAFRRKNEVPDALRDYDLACAAGRSHDCFTH